MSLFEENLCPVCHNKLQIHRLSCPNCRAEYPVNDFLTPYDYLTNDQSEFLIAFLKCRGNLKFLGKELGISYPTIKKKLDELLTALGYIDERNNIREKIDLSNFGEIDCNSIKASDIIKKKLYESGGDVTVPMFGGEPCRIITSEDGAFFTSDKLENYKLKIDYLVFDVIVDLLISSDGGRAAKGNSRGKDDKVGYGRCTADTVVGAVAINYFGKSKGESAFDPVFVLSAVLDWAEIAKNGRGFIELTSSYRSLRESL